jgi:Lar family restriction alleviation protein
MMDIKQTGLEEPCAEERELIESGKPCPFCGARGEDLEFLFGIVLGCRVNCIRCEASGPKKASMMSALSEWNHRI